MKRFTGDRNKSGALTVVFGYSFSKNFQDANFLTLTMPRRYMNSCLTTSRKMSP